MFGFNFGKKRVLGVDIGTSVLKVVELEIADGKPPYLINYAWMTIPEMKRDRNDSEQNFFEMIVPEYLKELRRVAKFTTKEAYVSISALGGMLTIIDLPAMPAAELEQAVRFEAHKYIPTSLDDVAISWEVVDGEHLVKDNKTDLLDNDKAINIPKTNDGQQIQVFLAAAFKNKILNYEKAVKLAGLKSKGIEIESLSMVESLIGNDQGNFIIVDIGFRVCGIVYVEKGIIRASRDIDAGGADITRAIATGMGISEERAESLKVSGKNFFSVDSVLRFPVLDMISSEVARIIEASAKNKDSHKLDSIILSGGTAGLVGLDGYFQAKFGIKTVIGNPFGRVAYDKKLEPVLEKMRNEFSVCLGLALKETEKKS